MQQRIFGVVSIYGLLIAAAMGLSVWLCARQEKRLARGKGVACKLINIKQLLKAYFILSRNSTKAVAFFYCINNSVY